MDENAAASLALSSCSASGIGEDVDQIKAGNSDVLAAIESLRQTDAEGFRQLIARDSELAIATDSPDDSGNWVTTVTARIAGSMCTTVAPWLPHTARKHEDPIKLVAFLLNLGATLWLAFSDKWRS